MFHCSPGCVGSHIQSIWQILEGKWDDEGKVGAPITYKCPIGLLLWCLTQFRGEVVERILGSVSQETSLPQTTTYQSPSRCQIGPRSEWSSVSSSKHSQRCSPGRWQAKQGPVSKVSSFLNTPQMSERETLPPVGRKTPVLLRLCAQCLVRLSF